MTVSLYTIFACDYIDTFKDEVLNQVVGLSMITEATVKYRYAFMIFILFDSMASASLQTEDRLPEKACAGVAIVWNVLSVVVTYSATGTMILCLYAILGARKIHLYFFGALYFAFLTTSVVLMANYVHSTAYDLKTEFMGHHGSLCEMTPLKPLFKEIARWTIFIRESGR
ncbi:hypothetical protein H1R20_g14469, partial [Candolleomyces eurysporus]